MTAVLHDLSRPLPRGLCRRLSVPVPGGSTRHHGNHHFHVDPAGDADNPNAPGSAFLVHDQFNTQNSFNGGDLGMKFEFQRNRWSLDVFPRIALGSTHSVVDINGSTRTTNPAGVGIDRRQPAVCWRPAGPARNIGHYTQNNFAVVPELDLKFGFQFTRHTRLVFGYDVHVLEQRGPGGRADRSDGKLDPAAERLPTALPRRGPDPRPVYLPEDRILGPGHQCRRGLPVVMNLRPLSSRWV